MRIDIEDSCRGINVLTTDVQYSSVHVRSIKEVVLRERFI